MRTHQIKENDTFLKKFLILKQYVFETEELDLCPHADPSARDLDTDQIDAQSVVHTSGARRRSRVR
jgi:hypothetical protein